MHEASYGINGKKTCLDECKRPFSPAGRVYAYFVFVCTNGRLCLHIILVSSTCRLCKVYDVTPYLGQHPGGDAILRNAGGDSTEGMYGPQHPMQAMEILEQHLIGSLEN